MNTKITTLDIAKALRRLELLAVSHAPAKCMSHIAGHEVYCALNKGGVAMWFLAGKRVRRIDLTFTLVNHPKQT